jgi:hypothetical protein
MVKKKNVMIKKEHLYTFDEDDRLVQLNKFKITRTPVNENEKEKENK